MSDLAQYADFGPLIIETDIDEAVITTLRRWLPTNLAQIERERNLDARLLARPVHSSYANALEDAEFPDHQLPAIIVTTAQTATAPTEDGNGFISAAWQVRVSAVVRGRTPPETRWVAAMFGGSVRRVLRHKESLGGLASETRWFAGRVAAVTDLSDNGRYLAAGINEFTVFVDNVLRAGVGPMDPFDPSRNPDTPYDPPLDVSIVETTVEGVPIGEP